MCNHSNELWILWDIAIILRLMKQTSSMRIARAVAFTNASSPAPSQSDTQSRRPTIHCHIIGCIGLLNIFLYILSTYAAIITNSPIVDNNEVMIIARNAYVICDSVFFHWIKKNTIGLFTKTLARLQIIRAVTKAVMGRDESAYPRCYINIDIKY